MTRTSIHGFDLAWSDGEWHTRIALPAWRSFLHGAPGDLVEVGLLHDEAEPETPPPSAQLVTLREFEQQQEVMLRTVVPAMRRHYDELRPRFLEVGFFADPDRRMPKNPDAAAFAKLHMLQGVFFHRTQRDGRVYVGLSFRAEWDVEHGVGVLVHGSRIVHVGDAAMSFIGWNAEEDAEGS